MRNYSENAYKEAIAGLKKHTGDGACTNALDDMFKKLDDERITDMFIRENGTLLTDFCRFFKGVEDVPTKYWLPLFNYYDNNIARNTYARTKRIAAEYMNGNFEHDVIYLSLISHLDCAAHSIVNQLKRKLGIFERFNKLSNR